MASEQMKILLIEDNPTDAQVIQSTLDEAGEELFHLLIVEGLAEALNQLREEQVDIVLLDLFLTDSRGLDTLHQVLAASPLTPVVVLSAFDDEEIAVESIQAGAQDYLVKPDLQARLLLRTIHQAVERKRIAQERERLIEDLDAFAQTVAHDLKSPLTLILGYTEGLQRKGNLLSAEERNHWLDEIQRHAKTMGNIIDELLLLASVRSSQVSVQHLQMAQIVESARLRLAYLIDDYGAEITVPESWPAAVGHAPWVEQVWVNYLSNAIKYGGRPPRIEMGGSSQPEGMSRFWICNNGPPIPSAALQQLFQPFIRLEQVGGEGHGLGLSIVRRIVEKLGGQVGVHNREGGGPCFTFTLPGQMAD